MRSGCEAQGDDARGGDGLGLVIKTSDGCVFLLFFLRFSEKKNIFFPAHTQETQWLTFFPLSRSLSSRRLSVRTTHELAPVVFTVHEHDENYK